MSNGKNDLKYEVLEKTNQIYLYYFISMEKKKEKSERNLLSLTICNIGYIYNIHF